MNTLIAISITLLLAFCALGLFVFIYLIKNNNLKKVEKELANFKMKFSNDTDKKIFLNNHNFYENFNIFPFKSDFLETRKNINDNNLVEFLSKTQNSFYIFWASKERELFEYLEQISKETKNRNLPVMKLYRKFSEQSFQIFNNTFIKRIMDTTHLSSVKFIDDFFKNIVDKSFQTFSNELDKLTKIIIDEVPIIEKINHQSDSWNETDDNKNRVDEENLLRCYKLLGVTKETSNESIKKAYRSLARKYHPDKNKTIEAKELMAQINNAYDIIKKHRNI